MTESSGLFPNRWKLEVTDVDLQMNGQEDVSHHDCPRPEGTGICSES